MVLILTVLKQYKLLLESRHEVEPPDSVIWLELQPFLPLSSKSSKSVGVMLWPLGKGNDTIKLWIELTGMIKDGVISITQEHVVLLGVIIWSSLFDVIMQFLRPNIDTVAIWMYSYPMYWMSPNQFHPQNTILLQKKTGTLQQCLMQILYQIIKFCISIRIRFGGTNSAAVWFFS